MPNQLESLQLQISVLEREVAKKEKINQALLKRVKTDLTYHANAADLFQHNVRLQDEIKNTRQQLAIEKDVFETLYNKSSDAVILFKTDTTFDCNEAAMKLLQLSCQTGVTYKELLELSPPNQPDGVQSDKKFYAMIDIAVKQGLHRFEWQNRKSDGELFWTDIVLTKIKISNAPIIHCVLRDISTQKILEKEIIVEKELALKASQLKSTFLANMSHELRTPMHSVLSFAQIGLKKASKTSQESLIRYFTNINTSGERLLHLLNDLLDLSKLESGKMVLNKEPSNLISVYKKCLREEEQNLRNKNITVELKEKVFDIHSDFDPFRIGQVITNLLSNAIKFSPSESLITISVKKQDNKFLIFSMQDQGVGIPEDERSTIFDHFVQSSKTKTNEGGTGLGLAISKEIIEQHGGKIWAENCESSGSKFCFSLPTME